MVNHETGERISNRPDLATAATYANIAASSWNQNEMRALSATTVNTDNTGILGDFQLFDDMAGSKKGI